MLGSERTNAMSNHPRRDLTPWVSRKRKVRDGYDAVKPSTTGAVTSTTSKAAKPDSCNRLLAGYLAHEFLTHGTLFGQKWNPGRPEAGTVSAASVESKRLDQAEPPFMKHQSYAEVSNLLKTDGAHIAGVVNPTQLARWIQM